jgi:hypothetical protein
MPNDDSNQPLVVAPTLRAAYAAADYEVVGGGVAAVLRIGARAPRVALEGGASWRRIGVITAWNPFSATSSAEQNAARQARLARDVERASRRWLPALGSDPAGDWAPEASLAVVDPSVEELDDWMLAFGQNAVVVAEAGGLCVLRWHPHEATRLELEGPVAERTAVRLWARAWTAHDVDLLEGALDGEVVYSPLDERAAIQGRVAVCERLHSELETPSSTERSSVLPGDTSRSEPGRPCAMLFRGAALTPEAFVHFTLQRGSITRVDAQRTRSPGTAPGHGSST